MLKWLDCTSDPKKDLIDQAGMMENAGTGGAIFRNLFRDFLYECLEYFTGNKNLETGSELYAKAASNWTTIAGLLKKAGETSNYNDLKQASEICFETAYIEKEAMERLVTI